MGMKLLSPTEVKDQKAQEQTRDIIRTQEIKDALNSINKQFAKAQTDFNDMLVRNRSGWAKEEEDHMHRVAEMEAELSVLQDKRAKALEPIEALNEQSEERMAIADRREKTLDERSEFLDQTRELLEEKLSEVGEREIDVSNRENHALIREQANEVETNIIRTGMTALQKAQAEFEAYKETEEMIVISRKTELRKEEINLEAREEKIKRDTESIERAKVQIADARGVIAREYERLNIPV